MGLNKMVNPKEIEKFEAWKLWIRHHRTTIREICFYDTMVTGKSPHES